MEIVVEQFVAEKSVVAEMVAAVKQVKYWMDLQLLLQLVEHFAKRNQIIT